MALLAAVALLLEIPVAPWGPWFVVGTLGQACWVARFPLQWLDSERRGEATLPPIFFRVSFFGSGLLLAYAVHTGVAVFIAGMILGPVLYARGWYLGGRSLPASRST
jgi:lipid-A-disaccharide synthase-like uncharacterized protein